MSSNTFGHLFRLTTFGESHGPAIGAVIDGCPSEVRFDEALLHAALARRRPGGGPLVSGRNEPDLPTVLSGVYEGLTLGTPIGVVIQNQDARPNDYDVIAKEPRVGHADDTWQTKFGHVDPRGGGRASGRETAARVVGGAFARMFCQEVAPKITVTGFACAIGPFALSSRERSAVPAGDPEWVDGFDARFPSSDRCTDVAELLLAAKRDGLSYGGIAEVRIDSLPPGLGQPVFRKLKSDLGAAYLSVGATAGVEFGAGFGAARAEGSAFHDPVQDESPQNDSDIESTLGGPTRYGGIRGGITTGETVVSRVAFKPTATVLHHAKQGRHDPCIVPRAIPVLEAMTWLVIADHLLWARADRAGSPTPA